MDGKDRLVRKADDFVMCLVRPAGFTARNTVPSLTWSWGSKLVDESAQSFSMFSRGGERTSPVVCVGSLFRGPRIPGQVADIGYWVRAEPGVSNRSVVQCARSLRP